MGELGGGVMSLTQILNKRFFDWTGLGYVHGNAVDAEQGPAHDQRGRAAQPDSALHDSATSGFGADAKLLQQKCNTRGFIYVNAYARTSIQRAQKVAAPVGVATVTVCSLPSTPLSIRFRIDAW